MAQTSYGEAHKRKSWKWN